MRCAVIGSNGYIGSHLVTYLKSIGVEVSCYDIQEKDEYGYTTIDLLDKGTIDKINLNVDYIFLMSGLTGTYAGFDKYEQFVDLNEKSLLHLLNAIRISTFRPRIVFPSTRLVYQGSECPLTEDAEKNPKTLYAVNKLACEYLLKIYQISFDIPYTIFRICVPYGNLLSDKYSFGTIGFFIQKAQSGQDIPLYGGGELKRTFTSVADICMIMYRGVLSNGSENEIFNIGGDSLKLKEAALLIARKYKVGTTSTPWPDKDLRIESGSTFFCDDKLQKVIGGFEYQQLENFVE